MNKHYKAGFTPISMERYIELYLRSNRDFTREEVVHALNEALDAHRNGAKCDCGKPIWVVGSAVAGNGCFTYITGEPVPEEDYEIDTAM